MLPLLFSFVSAAELYVHFLDLVEVVVHIIGSLVSEGK